jgi:hypothetical protein
MDKQGLDRRAIRSRDIVGPKGAAAETLTPTLSLPQPRAHSASVQASIVRCHTARNYHTSSSEHRRPRQAKGAGYTFIRVNSGASWPCYTLRAL